MRRSHSLRVSLIAVLWLIVLAGPVQAESTTRTPPYDFGSVTGTLVGGRVPVVTVTYSIPPFPALSHLDYGVEAGVYVVVDERSRITMTAHLRRDDLSDLLPGVEGCLGLTTPGSLFVPGRSSGFRFGCGPLGPSGEVAVVSTDFGESVWGQDGFDPGTWGFFVYLEGTSLVSGPSRVQVESISLELTPMQ